MGTKMLLVGCGKMGGALLSGWLDADKIERCVIIEPGESVARPWADWDQVEVIADPDNIGAPGGRLADFIPDIVVFAVKPQVMGEAVPAYRRFVRPETVFLSIAAGKSIGWLAAQLGAEAPIVRAMPNTPAAVRAGITVCCQNDRVSEAEHELAEYLLSSVGRVAWVEDESLIDAATAVSGGGPAYVFLLMEALAQAGIKAGLPDKLAEELARSTVIGAGQLARQSGDGPRRLRRKVTSPGGTTAEALEVLMGADGIQPLFDRAIAAATARSRALSD